MSIQKEIFISIAVSNSLNLIIKVIMSRHLSQRTKTRGVSIQGPDAL